MYLVVLRGSFSVGDKITGAPVLRYITLVSICILKINFQMNVQKLINR